MSAPADDHGRDFPPEFLFGCASAAHQVEGGNRNDWTRWEEAGHIKDGGSARVACDHYHRYADDLRDLAALGQNAHRFSVEWSRIEPEEGSFDDEALQHYREVVVACREAGLEPLVTLQHFTLPLWLADRGGLLYRGTPDLFRRFAALCAERFGDLVTWWTTVNEPEFLAVLAHLMGEFPPGGRSVREFLRALRTLLGMHLAAAGALRAVARRHHRTARVSIAHDRRPLRPRRARSPLDRAVAALPHFVMNSWFLNSLMAERVLPPVGLGGRLPGARRSIDYIGLNFYGEDTVAFDLRAPGMLFSRLAPPAGLPQSTFGWAIDPPAFRRSVLDLWDAYHLPIVVLENGVADIDDELRPAYIRDHLGELAAAMRAGADVRGYLHWTALDNFEWAQGYSQRFGLFAVDPATLERRPKPSAAVYAAICRSGRVASGAVHEDGAT